MEINELKRRQEVKMTGITATLGILAFLTLLGWMVFRFARKSIFVARLLMDSV
jgi:hypothetical protein